MDVSDAKEMVDNFLNSQEGERLYNLLPEHRHLRGRIMKAYLAGLNDGMKYAQQCYREAMERVDCDKS